MSLTLWRKTVFLNIFLLLLVWSKTVVLTNPNFPQDLPLWNMVRKTDFLSISVLISEVVTFMSKKKVLYEFLQKFFKTTERHSLPVCGSLFVEKHFLLIFNPFYWFDQKNCLNKSKFYSGFSPFKHGKKNKFLTISVLVSEIVTFMYKKKSSLWISAKILQKNRKS